MSTEDQPTPPPLTRRQLREMRNTGATPILPTTPPAEPESVAEQSQAEEVAAAGDVAPVAESESESATAPAPSEEPPASGEPTTRSRRRDRRRGKAPAEAEEATAEVAEPQPEPMAEPTATDEPGADDVAEAHDPAEHPISQAAAGLAADDTTERGTVSPQLGAALLSGYTADSDDRPSFDQLISRTPTASTSAQHALIVTDTQPQGITAPVNATGDVLVTGSLALPEMLGRTGQLPGSDGMDIDGALADGELPQHSSPTPIAASAAISTVKPTAEIISPPAPEKGSRLMLTLAITAGVLALALVGVLILAFVTGVFS
ncbi:hypothetical protein GCM10009808_06580 [Microbacterium sediminicola]|uniref:Uncharacterized protein n=1 Tax=Microbacterium sediminicola TaxID=415210 RepID=A0ABP4TQS5_9MICO